MINQNTGRGLLLAVVALFFLLQGPNYTIGNLSKPGPGLFPVMVAVTLLVISVAIVVRSYFIEALPFDFRIRNIALIATIASFASDDFSIPRTGAIIVVLCLIAFAMKQVLGVQLPLY